MPNIIRTHGIKGLLLKDLKELNGFHEVTQRDINYVTQPEWKAILEKYYPGLDMNNKNISVDLENEIISIE